MQEIKINHLDHVAIRVKDLEASAKWYKQTLGLKIIKTNEWGPYPFFLVAGKTGIALFPMKEKDSELRKLPVNILVDHFAFNVDLENFNLAKQKFESLNIDYIFNDHHYTHSIYIKDPDGHTVELTTLVVDEKSFY